MTEELAAIGGHILIMKETLNAFMEAVMTTEILLDGKNNTKPKCLKAKSSVLANHKFTSTWGTKMVDRRLKNQEWQPGDKDGNAISWERVQVAVLMDIRDELKALRRIFECQNFQQIPRKLDNLNKRLAVKFPLSKVKKK